ncbi:MAG: endonuclease NucS [Bifidobacteriaceae bacterium]|nr:endonuclease NucS [Bifidobacteriaceae bacterium]
MRLVIATCEVDYSGRLQAHLPLAKRLILVKADGSVLVHSDGGSYKPLNWMAPPATLSVHPVTVSDDGANHPAEGPASSAPREGEVVPKGDAELRAQGVTQVWTVRHAKSDDQLIIRVHEVFSDESFDLGVDPGLMKDGVEAHLQQLLAAQIDRLGAGSRLIRREYPTAIGPVDILARDAAGGTVAVEIKRRGEIDGVEQLTRYLQFLNADPLLAPVQGVFAAQAIKPQARALARSRGIRCVLLDYDEMRGARDTEARLF